MLNSNIQFNDVEQRKKEDHGGVVGIDNKSPLVSRVVNGRRVFPEGSDYIFYGNIYGNRSEDRGTVVRNQMGGLRRARVSSQGDNSGYKQKRVPEKICRSSETIHNTIDGIQDKPRVFDLTVEDDHTYTANGIVVSNCHRVPADTAYQVAMSCNAPVRIGASATPTRTDGAEKKIFAAFGEIKSRITADELIKRGLLAKPEFVFLTPPTIYIGRRSHWSDAYLQGIVINEGRNDLIVKKAIEYAKQKNTVYIHVERIDHGEILSERIPGSVFLSGRDGTTKRQGILKKFGSGELPVLVSTLLKEGTDIPGINVFVAAGGMKSPISVIQKAGRALRIAPGKDSAIIVDFRDSGRYLADHWSDRYSAYKETFGDYVPDVGQS